MPYPTLPNGMITGKLRPSEKAKIEQKLKEKGVGSDTPCELCRQPTLIVGDYIVSPQGMARSPNGLGVAPADPSYPAVTMLCLTCGNMKLINLAILKPFVLLDQDAPNE